MDDLNLLPPFSFKLYKPRRFKLYKKKNDLQKQIIPRVFYGREIHAGTGYQSLGERPVIFLKIREK